MNERETLLRRVQQLDFALVDAGLFLDGAPGSQQALDFFRKQQDEYRKAVQEYESRFGPLQMKTGAHTNGWRWIEEPWPWEGVDN